MHDCNICLADISENDRPLYIIFSNDGIEDLKIKVCAKCYNSNLSKLKEALEEAEIIRKLGRTSAKTRIIPREPKKRRE